MYDSDEMEVLQYLKNWEWIDLHYSQLAANNLGRKDDAYRRDLETLGEQFVWSLPLPPKP